ncbi:MAG: hypothetical protein AAGF25_14280, partial [Pseudomonadota bacterium]
ETYEVQEEYERIESLPDEIGDGYITLFSINSIRPLNWPKFLKYRLKPKFVETKTGLGVIRPRQAHALEQDSQNSTSSRIRPLKEEVMLERRTSSS